MCEVEEQQIEYAIAVKLLVEALKRQDSVNYLTKSLAPLIVIPRSHLKEIVDRASSIDREDWHTFNGYAFFEVENLDADHDPALSDFLNECLKAGIDCVDDILVKAQDLGYLHFSYWGICQARREVERWIKFHSLWD